MTRKSKKDKLAGFSRVGLLAFVTVNDHSTLDLFGFANSQRSLSGTAYLEDLPRILNEAAPNALEHKLAFSWHAVGERREVLADKGKTVAQAYLRLTIDGAIWLICQRCLEPYEQPLSIEVSYRIVATEEQAEAAPPDEDVDVLVGSRRFNLHELLEEELLLALPLVPKHPVCPSAHPSLAATPMNEAKTTAAQSQQQDICIDNPFAVLAALKKSNDSN